VRACVQSPIFKVQCPKSPAALSGSAFGLWTLDFGLFNHDRRDAFAGNLIEIRMAVVMFPADGEEQVAGFGLAGIGADIFEQRPAGPAPDFSVAGFNDKFQRPFFHKNQ